MHHRQIRENSTTSHDLSITARSAFSLFTQAWAMFFKYHFSTGNPLTM
jgi:hypothetical protein